MISSRTERIAFSHVNSKAGLTLEELAGFLAAAESEGIPGDTQVSTPGMTLLGQSATLPIRSLSVSAVLKDEA